MRRRSAAPRRRSLSLAGAVPKAEFNDGRLSHRSRRASSRACRLVLGLMGGRRGDVQGAARAASLSVGVRAQKDAARPRARGAAAARPTDGEKRALRRGASTAAAPPTIRSSGAPRSPGRPGAIAAHAEAPAARPFNTLLGEAAAARAVASVLGALPDAGAAAVAATSRPRGHGADDDAGGGGGGASTRGPCP